MTTQPNEAVGSDSTAEPADTLDTFEQMAAEHFPQVESDEFIEEEDLAEDGEDEGDIDDPDGELDEAEADEQDEADEQPPIDPPNSLTAEEKEAFKAWPRDAQEAFTRRVTDLEKGFQTKAQEAARAKAEARNEAMQQVAQIRHQQAEELEHYAQQLLVPRPAASLMRQNPDAYYRQLEAHEASVAQAQQAQQQAKRAAAERDQYIAALEQEERKAFHTRLQAELPDWFDATNGPKLQSELTAIAKEIGYGDDLIANANADDIIALKRVSEWKAKAAQLDALNSKKMEKVRAAKGKPKMAQPGVSVSADRARSQRAAKAFEQAKNSQGAARVDAFADYLDNSGQI